MTTAMQTDNSASYDPQGCLEPFEISAFERAMKRQFPTLKPEDVRIVSKTPVLWAGWECDHTAVLIDMTGSREIVVFDGIHVGECESAEALLRDRLQAYESAAKATAAMLRELDR